MQLKPLAGKVFLGPVPESELATQLESGIHLPLSQIEAQRWMVGIVVALGTGIPDVFPEGLLAPGRRVCVRWLQGQTTVTFDGQDLRVVWHDDILAVLDESPT